MESCEYQIVGTGQAHSDGKISKLLEISLKNQIFDSIKAQHKFWNSDTALRFLHENFPLSLKIIVWFYETEYHSLHAQNR
jgi:hypothetical protein